MSDEWQIAYARGHHGYPQPEDGYENSVYGSSCARRGLHAGQVAPFRIRRGDVARHSQIVTWRNLSFPFPLSGR